MGGLAFLISLDINKDSDADIFITNVQRVLRSYYTLFIQTVIDGWYAEWPGAVMDPIKVMCGPASSEITGSRPGAPAPHLQSYCY